MNLSRRSRRRAGDNRALDLLLACGGALLAVVLIAACGAASPKSTDGPPSRQQAQADAVEFAKCLREHGIKAEVSTSGGGVAMRIGGPHAGHTGGPAVGAKPSRPPGFEVAQRACRKYMPGEGKAMKLSPAEEAKQREDAAKFARCLRSHGVDVTETSGGVLELPSGVDPQSKSFDDAQKACQGLMGKLPLRLKGSAPGGGGFQSETARAGG